MALVLGPLVLAAAFSLLTAAVVLRFEPLMRFDERVIATLASRRSERLDWIIGPLSMLSTQEPLTVQAIVAIVMIIATIGWGAALHFVVGAVGSGILNEVAKRAVRRPRPAVPHLIRWIRGLSYPSGDLLTATAIYLTIAFIVSPHVPAETPRLAMYALVAGLVAMLAGCRMYAGVHYPSDVVGGVLLGAAWALFVGAMFV